MLQYYYLLYMKSQGTRPHDYRGHSRIRPRSGFYNFRLLIFEGYDFVPHDHCRFILSKNSEFEDNSSKYSVTCCHILLFTTWFEPSINLNLISKKLNYL